MILRPLALGALGAAALASAAAAHAADAPPIPDNVEVTATRVPELVDNVPASISLISGADLRARGARDLRTALGLLAGVEGTPGGDGGPAGSVPSLWGLGEADAFLLVVDDVPWGGAFNPATPSVDLTGVERIEVLRGAAPVMYGATSFVGVIHVIHYAAGATPTSVGFTGGSYGSVGASATTALPALGGFRHSLTLDLEKRGYAEDRTGFERYHVLYRGAADLGAAHFHVDGDVSILPQDPSGNLLLRDGATLHGELPSNVNYNPAGAKLNQQRYHLTLGLDGDGALGRWAATLAVTRTLDDVLRGFLRGDAFVAPPDAGVGDGLQADGYSQTRGLTDVYLDAHLTTDLGARLNLTYGVDHLHGRGHQDAINFGYCIDPAGVEFRCDGARHPDEIVQSTDTRDFSGAYAQADIHAAPSIDVLAGVRLNHTRETASGLAIDNTGAAPAVAFDGRDARTTTRLSGVLGASWHAWKAGADGVTVYADYRNSFKPLAIDFGPEAEVQVLRPETANSYEAGVKAQLLDGRLDVDGSVFRMDFRNGLTYADDGTGTFVRANGAETRFKGAEVEARYVLRPGLRLSGHYALHDARFVALTRDNGADASGNHVEMSPRQQGGLGLEYAGERGPSLALVASYSGARYLNKSNSVRAGGYTTLDATVGWRAGRWRLQLSGYNLTDRRDPVAESELQQTATVTATAGYYRLPARTLLLSLNLDL
jgi:outer membrane receptor protein involved in Fe transport